MTTPEPIEPANTASQPEAPAPLPTPASDERRRRILLVVLLFLLMLCLVSAYFIIRYITTPQPIPQMLPLANQGASPPTYKLQITGVSAPVGVAVSPDGQRIYVTESSGDNSVKMFDRDGKLLRSFSPPLTTSGSRQLRYLAVSKDGRVFIVDRIANAIHIFSQDGDYLDSIVNHNDTASKLIVQKLKGPIPAGTSFAVDGLNKRVSYLLPGQPDIQYVEIATSDQPWGPLGVRFDAQGDLIYTDIPGSHNSVNIIPAAAINGDLSTYAPTIKDFGQTGTDPGKFNFPQTAVTDSKGNFYISDGSNYRVDKWSPAYSYISFFGFGSGDSGLNLPRGAWMDNQDRLYVADTVGSFIRVYDVSGAEPSFLFNLGSLGEAEGQFSYPTDICIDGSGRLYVADRSNNRVSVWTY